VSFPDICGRTNIARWILLCNKSLSNEPSRLVRTQLVIVVISGAVLFALLIALEFSAVMSSMIFVGIPMFFTVTAFVRGRLHLFDFDAPFLDVDVLACFRSQVLRQ